MSHLSPTALAFIPLADLLTQLENLISQIKFRLLSSDMIALSDQTTSTPKSFPKSFPSNFSSYRAFKRFQRAKAWRDQTGSTRSSPIRSPLSSARSSPPFIKYLHDYKKGKFNSADDFIISNSKEGGVINSISNLLQSDVPSSIIHQSSIPLTSEELGVTRSFRSFFNRSCNYARFSKV